MHERNEHATVNPIALTVLIASNNHAERTVMNPCKGTWVVGRDNLPEWIKNCANNYGTTCKNSAVYLIRTWKDRNNSIFPFGCRGQLGQEFELSTQHE